MQERGFTEKDWKLFRGKIADRQESYMDRLNKEYIELLNENGNPSDKFWHLEQRIKKAENWCQSRNESVESDL